MSIVWTIATDPTFAGNLGHSAASDGAGNWVVAADDDFLVSTNNAVTWTSTTAPFGGSGSLGTDVIWADTTFMATGLGPSFSTPLFTTSSDTVTWVSEATPWDSVPGIIDGIGWSSDLDQVVACGEDGTGTGGYVIATRTSGSWSNESTSPEDGGVGSRAAWSHALGLWTAVGPFGPPADDKRVLTSPDGSGWSPILVGGSDPGGSPTDVCWSPDLGLFCVVSISAFSAGGVILTSSDGLTWTNQSSPFNSAGISGVTWSSNYGEFFAASPNADGLIHSADGVTWTVDTTIGFRGQRLFASGDVVVVSGQDTGGVLSRVMVGRPPGGGAHVWQRF